MSKTYFCGPFFKALPVKVDKKRQLLKYIAGSFELDYYFIMNQCTKKHFYDEPHLKFEGYLRYFIDFLNDPELAFICEDGDVIEPLSSALLNKIRNKFPLYSSEYFKLIVNEKEDYDIEVKIEFTSKGIKEFDNLYSLYKLYSIN